MSIFHLLITEEGDTSVYMCLLQVYDCVKNTTGNVPVGRNSYTDFKKAFELVDQVLHSSSFSFHLYTF